MSIYIKGLDLPVNGSETLVRIYPNGEVVYPLDNYDRHAGNAVQVPDHGRLIDADEATRICREEASIYDLTDTPDFLSYLPTIIPADKEATP